MPDCRRRQRARPAATLLVLAGALLMTTGCGSTGHRMDGRATTTRSLGQTRTEVMKQIERVGGVLSDGGTVTGATGSYGTCGSDPTPADQYTAAGKLTGSGSLAARMKVAQSAVEQDGWKRFQGWADDSPPNVALVKDDMVLALLPDALRGSDALSFGITGPCVRDKDGKRPDYVRQDTIIANR